MIPVGRIKQYNDDRDTQMSKKIKAMTSNLAIVTLWLAYGSLLSETGLIKYNSCFLSIPSYYESTIFNIGNTDINFICFMYA